MINLNDDCIVLLLRCTVLQLHETTFLYIVEGVHHPNIVRDVYIILYVFQIAYLPSKFEFHFTTRLYTRMVRIKITFIFSWCSIRSTSIDEEKLIRLSFTIATESYGPSKFGALYMTVCQ